MAEKVWISAKTVKEIDQALPDWIRSLEMWINEKIILHGRFKEGVDYKIEDGEYFLSAECEEQLRQDEIAGVMGKSAERYIRRNEPKQQTHADTGDDFWQEIVEGRV